jgi:hypothetical protein
MTLWKEKLHFVEDYAGRRACSQCHQSDAPTTKNARE